MMSATAAARSVGTLHTGSGRNNYGADRFPGPGVIHPRIGGSSVHPFTTPGITNSPSIPPTRQSLPDAVLPSASRSLAVATASRAVSLESDPGANAACS